MIATTTRSAPPSVVELLARAGASDKDRPAWLAERLAGVTATEIRDLAVGKKRQAAQTDRREREYAAAERRLSRLAGLMTETPASSTHRGRASFRPVPIQQGALS